jgi:hypothetical protein
MNINKPRAVLFGLGIASFCSLLALGLLLILQSDWSSLRSQLSSDQQLIVINYSAGYIPGVIIGLATIALLFLALTLLLFLGNKAQQFKSMIIKYCTAAVVLCLTSIFVGELFFAARWDKQAQLQGYLPCPAGTILSNRLTYTAWVRNEALCFNADVRRIVSRGTAKESQQVEQYLQAQLKQQQTRQILNKDYTSTIP